MKLTKTIPARRKTVAIRWLKKDFMVMSEAYRKARSGMSRKMNSCFWCRHKFVDGEMMALANIEGSGNKLLCDGCIQELDAEAAP